MTLDADGILICQIHGHILLGNSRKLGFNDVGGVGLMDVSRGDIEEGAGGEVGGAWGEEGSG